MWCLYMFCLCFVSLPIDRYQVLGRTVHMDFVKEHLETKKNVNFGEKQDWPNDIELEILADTVYVKVSMTITISSQTLKQLILH